MPSRSVGGGNQARAVVSTDDPYAPSDPSAWAERGGFELDLLIAAGHITPESGYGPWPSMLRWCLGDGAEAIGPTTAL